MLMPPNRARVGLYVSILSAAAWLVYPALTHAQTAYFSLEGQTSAGPDT